MDLLHLTMLLLLFVVKMINGKNNEAMPEPESSSLSGKVLKVVIGQFGATVFVVRNSTGHVTGYGGVLYEQLNWLSLRLNFSLDMEVSIDNSFGVFINGSWDGMRGQLQRGEVDLACIPLSGSAGYDVLELAVYVVGDAFAIFTKYPTSYTAIDGPIKVFSVPIWISLIISIITCIGCIKLLTHLTQKYLADSHRPHNSISTVSDISLFIYGTLTNHCVSFQNSLRSVGIIAAAWCLTTFVFVNIYSSCMSSYMSLQFQRPDITTFQDLADNPNYQPTTIKGVTAEFIFLEAKSGTKLGKIGDKLRNCHPKGGCSISNYELMIKNILEGNSVGILPITVGEYFVSKTITNRQCRLTEGQESMAFLNMFMGVPKNSSYVMELNKQSFWWNSIGLQRYWMRKLFPVPRKCLLQYNNRGESVQFVERVRLKLEQFYVAFVILFVGYVLALIQFLRERFIHNSV